MQAVGLASGQSEYTLQINNSQQADLEALLRLFCKIKLDSLVNIYQYHSRPDTADTRSYSFVADNVADKLSDRSSRRQQGTEAAISTAELSDLATACILALSISQERVQSS
jgi:hypothetical protein